MLRISLGKICALCPSAQDERIIPFVTQPQYDALRIQKAADRAQHLPEELVWRWRGRENVQAIGHCLDLSAGDLLGSTQRLLSTITFNRNPDKVRR